MIWRIVTRAALRYMMFIRLMLPYAAADLPPADYVIRDDATLLCAPCCCCCCGASPLHAKMLRCFDATMLLQAIDMRERYAMLATPLLI